MAADVDIVVAVAGPAQMEFDFDSNFDFVAAYSVQVSLTMVDAVVLNCHLLTDLLLYVENVRQVFDFVMVVLDFESHCHCHCSNVHFANSMLLYRCLNYLVSMHY